VLLSCRSFQDKIRLFYVAVVTLELGVLLKSKVQYEIVKYERKGSILLTLLNKTYSNLKTAVLDTSVFFLSREIVFLPWSRNFLPVLETEVS
jgi:hypothetical protein